MVYSQLMNIEQCKKDQVNEQIFNILKIKTFPLFDLNDRDSNVIRVNLSNIPM